MIVTGSKLRELKDHVYRRRGYPCPYNDNKNIQHEYKSKIMYQNICKYRIEQQVLQRPIHTYNITFYLNTAHARNYKLDYTRLRA